MFAIWIGIAISSICVLIGVYGMIYYHAVAWISAVALSVSLGFTLSEWLKTNGYARRERFR
jgi:hypothetical protein